MSNHTHNKLSTSNNCHWKENTFHKNTELSFSFWHLDQWNYAAQYQGGTPQEYAPWTRSTPALLQTQGKEPTQQEALPWGCEPCRCCGCYGKLRQWYCLCSWCMGTLQVEYQTFFSQQNNQWKMLCKLCIQLLVLFLDFTAVETLMCRLCSNGMDAQTSAFFLLMFCLQISIAKLFRFCEFPLSEKWSVLRNLCTRNYSASPWQVSYFLTIISTKQWRKRDCKWGVQGVFLYLCICTCPQFAQPPSWCGSTHMLSTEGGIEFVVSSWRFRWTIMRCLVWSLNGIWWWSWSDHFNKCG